MQLEQLHDIVAPPRISWWPPAPGWYAVAAALLIGLAWLGYRHWHTYRANRYRRAALEELSSVATRVRDPSSRPAGLAALSALLKRVALSAWSREHVASLSGDAWIRFLDESGGKPRFRDAPARLAVDGAYATPMATASLSESDVEGLLKAARGWIVEHRAPPVLERGAT